jgi:hypothetical protein
MLVSVPLVVVNGWFALGIPIGFVLALLWWFDFSAELRASPPEGRAGRVLVVLAGVPQALFGLACFLAGVLIAGWVLWNLFIQREGQFEIRSLGAFFIVAALVMFGVGWMRGAFKDVPLASGPRLEAAWNLQRDEAGVSVLWPKGERRTIAWNEVDLVAIETNGSGPWGYDVWTVLEGGDKRVDWPQGATGEDGMLAELQRRFPGFDDDAVIAAMGCTDNGRFVCWHKGSSPESGK